MSGSLEGVRRRTIPAGNHSETEETSAIRIESKNAKKRKLSMRNNVFVGSSRFALTNNPYMFWFLLVVTAMIALVLALTFWMIGSLDANQGSGWNHLLSFKREFKLKQFHSIRSKDDSRGYTIFYQIFIPSDPTGRQNTLRIVKEQMAQVEEAINLESKQSLVYLYYYTIGNELPNRLKEYHFQKEYCVSGSLRCVHGGHVSKGSEDFTLQALYDFCRLRAPNLAHRVTYLHSKGSYHHSRTNENWRFHLTAAALHPKCLAPTNNNQCNVCGLQFFTEWTLFFPGNMWSADCSYVAQLLPPVRFEAAVELAVQEILYLKHRGVLESHLYPDDRVDRFGLDRYHTEHWIAGSPFVKPCDVSVSADLKPWLSIQDNRHEFDWNMAPRHSGGPADQLNQTTLQKLWETHDSRREVFYFAGLFLKFSCWYRQLPPADSWMFEMFPDGDFWKEIAAEKSNEVSSDIIEQVLLPLSPSSHANSSLRWNGAGSSEKYLDTLDTASSAIFFKIHSAAWEQQLETIGNSLSDTRGNKDGVALFYQLEDNVRKNDMESHRLCSTIASSCQPLQSGHDGDLLMELHKYCRSHPTSSVTYLGAFSNPEQVDDETEQMISEVNGECLQREIRTCNLCGPSAFSAAGFFFQKNTWSAKCSYVSQLLNPFEYIQSMDNVTKAILLMKAKRRILMKMFEEDASKYLPDQQRILSHWITSHPSVEMCSTSSSLIKTSIEWKFNPKEFGLYNETQSIRECAFLACRVLKWEHLYPNEWPSASSWIWSWFPDAPAWFAATKASKHVKGSIVEELAGPFADTKV